MLLLGHLSLGRLTNIANLLANLPSLILREPLLLGLGLLLLCKAGLRGERWCAPVSSMLLLERSKAIDLWR